MAQITQYCPIFNDTQRLMDALWNMVKRPRDILRTYPPRALAPREHALVAEWLSHAGDIVSAYVAERRSDDPAMYRRVVIVAGLSNRPSHLIHAPEGMSCWLLFSIGEYPPVRQFDTLREALNSIRPVLPDVEPAT